MQDRGTMNLLEACDGARRPCGGARSVLDAADILEDARRSEPKTQTIVLEPRVLRSDNDNVR